MSQRDDLSVTVSNYFIFLILMGKNYCIPNNKQMINIIYNIFLALNIVNVSRGPDLLINESQNSGEK